MKLALIPPVPLLRDTLKTNYQLMLPQMMLTSTHYAQFYLSLCKEKRQFVIMDNGAAEGAELDDELLWRMAGQLKPDEMAIPDVLGDSEATIKRAVDFLYGAPKEVFAQAPKLGIVAQGKNVAEAMHTVRELMNLYGNYISTVYVPRLLVKPEDRYARLTVAQHVAQEHPSLQIHLFGASPLWAGEVLMAAQNYPCIRGIDTSMPYNYAYYNEYVLTNAKALKRPRDYFNLEEEHFACSEHELETNIETMLRWASGHD